MKQTYNHAGVEEACALAEKRLAQDLLPMGPTNKAKEESAMKMKFKKRHWRQPGAGPCNCPHSKNEPLEQDAAQFLQGERLCQACVFLAHGFCVERRKKQAVDKLQQRPEQHGSA